MLSEPPPVVLRPTDPFDFSQTSLQDYRDCPRRFQLRWLMRLGWPAAPAEPLREYEEHQRRGLRFHRLAEQALSGLPEGLLEISARNDPDPLVARWWGHFRDLLPTLRQGSALPEVVLSAPLSEALPSPQRLTAKLDCLHLPGDGRVVIYDWKTIQGRTRRETLEQRLQTAVYAVLVQRGAAHLNQGQPVEPVKLEMVYWFAEHPHQPETFRFTTVWLEDAWQRITRLVAEIHAHEEAVFPLTPNRRHCRFCQYRSLCERGEAGGVNELEEDPSSEEIYLDFDQIGEIAF